MKNYAKILFFLCIVSLTIPFSNLALSAGGQPVWCDTCGGPFGGVYVDPFSGKPMCPSCFNKGYGPPIWNGSDWVPAPAPSLPAPPPPPPPPPPTKLPTGHGGGGGGGAPSCQACHE